MATLRDIKRRITSVQNTQKITNAMKMIAAAKLSRARNAAQAAQPYAERLRRVVTTMAQGLTGEDHPLFDVREGGATLVVLFTSDRGLCGGFNNNLSRLLHAAITRGELGGETELVVFGRKGNDFFRRRNVSIARSLVQLKEAERREAIGGVIEETVERFRSGEVGRVLLAFNQFYNAMRQEPRIMPLLPVVAPEPEQGARIDEREVLFEPGRGAILDTLVPKYLENQLLTAQLNTEAGEHGSRMVAMDGATRNAGDMIDSLTLQYNRARQAVITKELIEIVSGAEAL